MYTIFGSNLYEVQNDIGVIKKEYFDSFFLLHVRIYARSAFNVSQFASNKIYDGRTNGCVVVAHNRRAHDMQSEALTD